MFQETIISELEEEKGNFLCGPEWKVKITTKSGQDLDIKQVEDGNDFRVLISPMPPKEKEEEIKTVEKIAIKKNTGDNRYFINYQNHFTIVSFFSFFSGLCIVEERYTLKNVNCTTSHRQEFHF